MTIDRHSSALLVVDVQLDFLPGGALPVAESDRLIESLSALLEARVFGIVVATQDWHPPNHISFASRHPGRRPFETISLYGREQVLWPDHCVAGSADAALHPGVPWFHARAIVRKGTDPGVDSYSGFRNNWDAEGRRPPTGLASYLRELGVQDVYVCGLARDFCVKWTAEDAAELGFKSTVIWDLTRPVEPASDALVAESLRARNVRIVAAATLPANA